MSCTKRASGRQGLTRMLTRAAMLSVVLVAIAAALAACGKRGSPPLFTDSGSGSVWPDVRVSYDSGPSTGGDTGSTSWDTGRPVTPMDGGGRPAAKTCGSTLKCVLACKNNRTCVQACTRGAARASVQLLQQVQQCTEGARRRTCASQCRSAGATCTACIQTACKRQIDACNKDTGGTGPGPSGSDGGIRPPVRDGSVRPPGRDTGIRPPRGDGGIRPPVGDGGTTAPRTCSSALKCVASCRNNIVCIQACIRSLPTSQRTLLNRYQQCTNRARSSTCRRDCSGGSSGCDTCLQKACATEYSACLKGSP